MAVAVACGYTVDELKEIALSFDFGGIADETERATGVLSTPATISRLLSDFGAVSGDILAHKVDDIIRKQTGLSGATFQQLYDHTGILLKIFATSLRTGELLEFSSTRTPTDQVCVAARCSMAVPFLFDAVWTREGDRLVDGAVIDNCPVWCFDTEIKTARGSDSAMERGPDAQLGGDPRRFLKQEHASRAKFGGRIVPGAEGAGGVAPRSRVGRRRGRRLRAVVGDGARIVGEQRRRLLAGGEHGRDDDHGRRRAVFESMMGSPMESLRTSDV